MTRIATFNVNGVNGRLPVLLKWLSVLEDSAPSVLCGDFNVVPTSIDAVVPQRWVGDAVYFPESRQAYAVMLKDGWMDAVRRLHPDKGIYTYWNFSYRGGYDRRSGLRMDHLLVSPSLSDRLRNSGVDVELRGWERPSDHAPAWIELESLPSGLSRK